ncbi:lipoLPP family protein, putative [Babesia caballi]|uniref:LipoLPP family protein, putative n=1 Tax=Babesia caballi TaxID=5871 RepID=A0AAV4LSX5_BABCB|nr:lipoLPP family protein, putative [Babesia caballi]
MTRFFPTGALATFPARSASRSPHISLRGIPRRATYGSLAYFGPAASLLAGRRRFSPIARGPRRHFRRSATMQALDEADMDVLRHDQHYLNKLLARHCLHTRSRGNGRGDATTDTAAPPSGDASAPEDVTRAKKTPTESTSHRPANGYRNASSLEGGDTADRPGEGGPLPEQPPTIDELIQRMGRLSSSLWQSADLLQRDASDNVINFVQALRTSSTVGAPLDATELAASLRQCEDLVDSVSRKNAKFHNLMALDNLAALLRTNLDAVNLIHNWDETLRSVHGLFQSYKSFCDRGGSCTNLLVSDGDSDGFSHARATTLRDILLRLKSSRRLCVDSNLHFSSIKETLDELLLGYASMIDDMATDVLTRHFSSPLTSDASPTGLPDDAVMAFERLIALTLDVLDSKETETILLRALRAVLGKLLALQFSTTWEEHAAALPTGADVTYLEEDIAAMVAALSSTITASVEAFAQCLADNLELLKRVLQLMASQGIVTHPDAALTALVSDLLASVFCNFETFDDLLEPLPRDAFLTVSTAMMASLQRSAEDLLSVISQVSPSVDVSTMRIVPFGTFVRYVGVLHELSRENAWSGATLPGAASLEDHLSCLDGLVSHVQGLKATKTGVLSLEADVDICTTFAWVYNRLLLFQLRDTYSALMARCSQASANHFMGLSQREIPRDVTTDTETACHRLLSRLVRGTRGLSEAIETTLAAEALFPTADSVLSASVLHYFSNPQRLASLDGLPLAVRQCSEPFSPEAAASFFRDDSGAVDAAVTHVVRFIARRASAIMRAYYSAALSEPDADSDVSSTVLLLNEYFTALVPLFSDDDLLPLRALARAFTSFVDSDLERLVAARPSEPSRLRRYQADVAQLAVICDYCGADVKDSLDMLGFAPCASIHRHRVVLFDDDDALQHRRARFVLLRRQLRALARADQHRGLVRLEAGDAALLADGARRLHHVADAARNRHVLDVRRERNQPARPNGERRKQQRVRHRPREGALDVESGCHHQQQPRQGHLLEQETLRVQRRYRGRALAHVQKPRRDADHENHRRVPRVALGQVLQQQRNARVVRPGPHQAEPECGVQHHVVVHVVRQLRQNVHHLRRRVRRVGQRQRQRRRAPLAQTPELQRVLQQPRQHGAADRVAERRQRDAQNGDGRLVHQALPALLRLLLDLEGHLREPLALVHALWHRPRRLALARRRHAAGRFLRLGLGVHLHGVLRPRLHLPLLEEAARKGAALQVALDADHVPGARVGAGVHHHLREAPVRALHRPQRLHHHVRRLHPADLQHAQRAGELHLGLRVQGALGHVQQPLDDGLRRLLPPRPDEDESQRHRRHGAVGRRVLGLVVDDQRHEVLEQALPLGARVAEAQPEHRPQGLQLVVGVELVLKQPGQRVRLREHAAAGEPVGGVDAGLDVGVAAVLVLVHPREPLLYVPEADDAHRGHRAQQPVVVVVVHPVGLGHVDEQVGAEAAVEEGVDEGVGQVAQRRVQGHALARPPVVEAEVRAELGEGVGLEDVLGHLGVHDVELHRERQEQPAEVLAGGEHVELLQVLRPQLAPGRQVLLGVAEVRPVGGAAERQLLPHVGVAAAENHLLEPLRLVQLQREAQRLREALGLQQYLVGHNQHAPRLRVGRGVRRNRNEVAGHPRDEVVVVAALAPDGLYQVHLQQQVDGLELEAVLEEVVRDGLGELERLRYDHHRVEPLQHRRLHLRGHVHLVRRARHGVVHVARRLHVEEPHDLRRKRGQELVAPVVDFPVDQLAAHLLGGARVGNQPLRHHPRLYLVQHQLELRQLVLLGLPLLAGVRRRCDGVEEAHELQDQKDGVAVVAERPHVARVDVAQLPLVLDQELQRLRHRGDVPCILGGVLHQLQQQRLRHRVVQARRLQLLHELV